MCAAFQAAGGQGLTRRRALLSAPLLLSKILESFVSKLGSLKAEIPALMETPGDKDKEVNDCKLIVQNIVYGMKTLLFSILYCTRMVNAIAAAGAGGPPPPPTVGQQQGGMGDSDVRTCARLLTNGLACSRIVAYWGDCKEFCEHFAEIFTVMDVRDFVDVFSVKMGALVAMVVAEPDAMMVATHLVQSPVVGR
ncbi:hypothetical protein MNEG_15703 [Monoraphidium neglectum]|uniref:Uncharacterized protein n=1 Tax=Monoraphidium neglectum TaxID=145388 RepID=A0A0D2MA54_9CHLO|nr:hypothetical protein MNEG_15703 [Monoraphidium neglectum]KIY92260.1 hypothetical protein MNEG_15703 [Monoraphidium neglectum]|eukprot:XP_013891280.1 hypothetical protein MNEG_15703 [Monoraphidium neglectum]